MMIGADIESRWVQTDMGNKGAETFGFEKAEITLEESITGMVALVCLSFMPSISMMLILGLD